MCTHLSLISAPGHSLHQPISLIFLLSSSPISFLLMSSFDPFVLFQLLFFSDFFASLVLQNQNVHGRKFTISFLFSFLCFLFSFSCRFLVKEIWWQKTKHVTKISEWKQLWEWSPGSEKRVFSWRVFWAWPKVWVDGAESNEEKALADNFLARLGSSCVFLFIEWLMCDTDSPRDTRQWMLIIISLCSLFSLLSLCFPSFLNSWQQVTG